MCLVGKLSGLKHDFVVTYYTFKFILQVLERLFFTKGYVLHKTRSQNGLYAQNVNNLFDSPDFWYVRLSPLLSKTMHALTKMYQLLSVLFLCYLAVLPVFSCTLLFYSVRLLFQQFTLGIKYYTPPNSASIMQSKIVLGIP